MNWEIFKVRSVIDSRFIQRAIVKQDRQRLYCLSKIVQKVALYMSMQANRATTGHDFFM